MKKILTVIGIMFIMVLAACSSPEADEVLEYHNEMAENINPKLDEIDTIYTKVASAATDEEALEIFDTELVPLLDEIKDYYEKQDVVTDVAKEYHKLHVDLVNAMNDVVLKEKEYLTAFLDESTSEEDILALEAELEELNEVAAEKDQAVADRWDELVEKYDFIEEEE
jgi:hypothetical protein